MGRYSELFRWTILFGVTAVVVWLTVSRNTLFGLGVVAGVAAGSHRTAYRHLTGKTVMTAVATLSAGLFVAMVSIAIIATWWLPTLSTAALGYAIGVVAAWLLVSGASVEELGPFAAIGGLLIAVFGGAGGLLIAPDATLFVVVLFGGLFAGVVIPLSGLAVGLFTTPSTGRSTDSDQLKPATRFGIEAAAIATVAISVPFGSRAVSLFGQGGTGWFPVGLLGGVLLSVGIWAVSDGESTRLRRLHNWFVERAYRLLGRLDQWIERRRQRGSRNSLEQSAGSDEGGAEAAAAGDESPSRASHLVDQAATRLADYPVVQQAAEELESLSAENGLTDRVDMFWSRLSGAVERTQVTAGANLQLSAAEAAHSDGDTERARSLTDAALQLAAPTVGTVAAAVVRGRRSRFENVLDGLAPLFARIDELLADEQFVDQTNNPDQLGLVQRLLERLVDAETDEEFDSALARIRAAAADGWYSVQAGDQALANEDYHRALLAYLSAINAYRRAYDIATEAKRTATADKRAPDDADTDTDTGQPVDSEDESPRAAAGTYAAEATRIETALEALLYDTAAVTIAAIDDLYGDEPPPTVDTEYRRTIVRTLRVLRQTRTRIDATVPPIDLADDRYQHAELARSVARIRRHLTDADDTARRGNIEAALEQYERAADRLDVLSNRAATAGLSELARSLLSAATAIGQLVDEPTPEAISDRPAPSVPVPEHRRAPEAVPASRRLRRTFCEPSFVELWELTDQAADHPVLEFAGEPYPELVDAVSMALGSLDPLYTEPDVHSLQQWVAETTLDVLSAALETVATRHRKLCAMEPRPPPTFREPPAALDDELAVSVPTNEGVEAFADGWLSRADALSVAGETITRQQAAVDGFAALEEKVRETLADRGSIGTAQVSPELLEVAAYHLRGVSYDRNRQRLSKTGEISRRSHESTADEPGTSPDTDQHTTADTDSADTRPQANPHPDAESDSGSESADTQPNVDQDTDSSV